MHNALFLNLDDFINRCKELEQVINTNLNQQVLQNINIGGTKGDKFTKDIRFIMELFIETRKAFTSVDQDVMDVLDPDPENRKKFQKDQNKFNTAMKHIDKRVASVICQSFDDNTTFSSRFKLFEMFDELILRPKIDEEITKKQFSLLDAYKKDLKIYHGVFVHCSGLIEKQDPKSPIPRNMPASSGAIKWAEGNLDRFVPVFAN